MHATEQERWELSSPRVQVRLHGPVIRDLGLRFSPMAKADRAGYSRFDVSAAGPHGRPRQTFSFVSNRSPSAVGAVTVTLGVQEAPGGTLTVGILGPSWRVG